jgi:hypothetical protein
MPDYDVGPIDFLAVEIPQANMKGEGFAAVVDLVERGIIRVLDVRALLVGDDGSLTALSLSDVDEDGDLDLTVFDGAQSGLLSEEDVAEVAAVVGRGNAVVILLYENTWAGPFVTAMRRAGAELIASGRIPADDVASALDVLEAQQTDLASSSPS